MSDEQDMKTQILNAKQPTRELLAENFDLLVRDIIVPIRVIIAVFIVFLVFLIVDQLLFWLFVWLSKDIQTRVPFVGWLLDGIQVTSIAAVGIYFLYSTITNLQSQWRIAFQIGKRAGLNEDE